MSNIESCLNKLGCIYRRGYYANINIQVVNIFGNVKIFTKKQYVQVDPILIQSVPVSILTHKDL